MKKTLFFITVLALLILLSTSTVFAGKSDDEGYPWQDVRKAPFDFEFGNMIDTHQQSMLKKEKLQGFIYIHYTGEYTEDGIPIARKADCYIEECSVGWVIKGIPYQATLVNKGPRIWLIDPAGLPKEPGYTHFHWTGTPGKPHGLILNRPEQYDGYLLKRVAVTTFYWLGGTGNQGGSGGDGGAGGCGGEDGGCSGDHTDGGCSGGGGSMGGSGGMGGGCSDGGEEGGCTGGGEEGGCSGSDDGMGGGCSDGGEEGGCTDGGDEGGCSGSGGGMGGGCSGEDHSGGGCSGGDGSSGHGGRLVLEGLDPHSNIVTTWDGTWNGCGSDD